MAEGKRNSHAFLRWAWRFCIRTAEAAGLVGVKQRKNEKA